MAREYRLEIDVNRSQAMAMLATSPYFCEPSERYEKGEIWLTINATRPDVRVFPRPFGFFVEVTSLPQELSDALVSWISEMRDLGRCTIVDDDTDQVVSLIR
jgi:hypothetical protein